MVDLSKAEPGSEWRTRDGKHASFDGIQNNGNELQFRFRVERYFIWTNDYGVFDGGDRRYDIIGPWVDWPALAARLAECLGECRHWLRYATPPMGYGKQVCQQILTVDAALAAYEAAKGVQE